MPTPVVASEPLTALLHATRRLFWIDTPLDASAVAEELVLALGGRVVPAHVPSADCIPVDISFGAIKPLVPAAAEASVERMLLERYLPLFVRDAQRALELAARTVRLQEDASRDALTGLANRRKLGRVLGRAQPGTTIVMIDLDDFKGINDRYGHPEGDRVLRQFGRTLTNTLRAADRVGRYGGEEFLLVLADGAADAALRRIRHDWAEWAPYPVTFSAGIATIDTDVGKALESADRAMYRAKRSGRDQWQWATPGEYP